MKKLPSGQALLPLLIVMIIVLGLGTAAIELAIGNLIIDRYRQDEVLGYYSTQSALENALLRLLRNPNYTGESLQINGASCTITVSGSAPYRLVVVCDNGRWVRKIQAFANFSAGIMAVTQVREIE